jgi:uncharacterized SAM-binding protein YcdF (DUF218 family)
VPERATVLRALEAARLYRLIGARLVIASGGTANPPVELQPESAALADLLVRAGVPAARIREETESRTTREQAREIVSALTRESVTRFVLVTSTTHMPRAVAVFRQAGGSPIPSPAPIASDGLPPPSWLVPNGEASYRTNVAIYECAAWVYYWSTGAFRSGPPAAR